MVNRASCLGGIVSMAVLLAAMTPSVRGGTASPEDRPDLFRALAAPTQTADLRESLDAYLDPEGAGRLTGWRAIQAAWLQTAEVISPSGQSSTIIFAAAGEPVEPVTSPSGFAFPETVGRPLNTADAPGIPFGNTALLTLAPVVSAGSSWASPRRARTTGPGPARPPSVTSAPTSTSR